MEEPLPDFGACLLGSINLAKFVKNKFTHNSYFDFHEFKDAVSVAVRALNDVLDEGLPFHPLEQQKETARDLRQIGLGIMGYGDMLIMLGLEYGKKEALEFTEIVAEELSNAALQESARLARDFGTFPKYNKEYILNSEYLKTVASKETLDLIKKYGLRNSQCLTSAPTGSISTMWGITGGIEPIYQISYTRRTETLNDGETYYKVFTPIAREYMDFKGLQKESELPKFFTTAMTLNWEDRIKTQSVWQKYIDASISSTVNLPKEATVEDVKQLYIRAWQEGLKGVTIFRDGCKRLGILSSDTTSTPQDVNSMSIEELQDLIKEKADNQLKDNPDNCPLCSGKMIFTGGCSECVDCSYSPCSL